MKKATQALYSGEDPRGLDFLPSFVRSPNSIKAKKRCADGRKCTTYLYLFRNPRSTCYINYYNIGLLQTDEGTYILMASK